MHTGSLTWSSRKRKVHKEREGPQFLAILFTVLNLLVTQSSFAHLLPLKYLGSTTIFINMVFTTEVINVIQVVQSDCTTVNNILENIDDVAADVPVSAERGYG